MKNTMPSPHDTPAARYAAMQQAIGSASVSGRMRRSAPLLVGVSKTHPAEAIETVIAAGGSDFGENKVQEAQAKWPAIQSRHPQVRLHLIGPLQSNKAREAVALFTVIHTIDRPKIAEAVKAEMEKQGKQVACLIQVNIGEEPQKAGVLPGELADLLAYCSAIGLPICGLMCIPPATKNPAPYFALMQQLAARHGLKELSMGMSEDYLTAIRFGATMVRVGTALFGARQD